MDFKDTITLDAPRRTADGYMAASVLAARVGIQTYLGAEVGKPEMATVRVYRPESEVFHKDSLKTLAHKPVTIDHPPVPVTSKNWRDYAAGLTGDEIARDGDFVRVPLALMDAGAISAVLDGGKRELSCGYTCDLDWTAGVTADGQEYDASQKNIRFNHLAVVGMARGGHKLKIGDRKPMTKTIVFDGISIEVTDQAAQAIDKLQAQNAKLTADMATAAADHAKTLATADAAKAKAEAERDAAQGKIMDDAAIDARVAVRADLIATAKAIHDHDYTGKTDAEIRKIVVTAKGITVDGKPEAYVDARFDILAEDAKSDAGMRANISRVSTTAPAGTQQAIVDASFKAVDTMNAWRTQQ